MTVGALIPTRFLLLVGHLVLTIVLFWAMDENILSCLPESYTTEEFNNKKTNLTVGLSMTIVFLAIEFCGFMSGITMFMPSQDLLSIGAHGSATICLAFFIMETWPCNYFWWVFGFCTAFPGTVELLAVVSSVLLNWNF